MKCVPPRTGAGGAACHRSLGSDGMTLIEVMVALGLVAVAILPLLASIPWVVTATRGLVERTEACQVALAELELIKNQPYDDIGIGESVVSEALGSSFDAVNTVEDVEVASDAHVLRITVDVYRHPYSEDESPVFSAATLLAEGGV